MFARSRDWTALLPLRGTLSALYFQPCQLLKPYDLHCLEIELADKNLIKELGVFGDGKVQGYSFCPPKITNPQNNRLVHKKLARNCVEQWKFGLQ